MSWVEKGAPTPFDGKPIPGLYFLDGDMVANFIERDWTRGQMLALVEFPSGVECELWASGDEEAWGIVHLFGEMDLPLRTSDFEEVVAHAKYVAEVCNYRASPVGENRLHVTGNEAEEDLIVTYDPDTGLMADVEKHEGEYVPPRMELLPDEIRKRLPTLYETEEQGLEALALVKFFTPDSDWTWYASEFDGEDTFFGLVSGLDVELGYFLLSELEGVRGPMGLPIERDKFFEPTTLRELQEKHRRENRM